MKILRPWVLLAVWLLLPFPARAQQTSIPIPITAQEIAALKTAILDEIYDYDFEGEYIDISLLTPSGYELHLYINPKLENGGGQVIFKLPIGEVARNIRDKRQLGDTSSRAAGQISLDIQQHADSLPS